MRITSDNSSTVTTGSLVQSRHDRDPEELKKTLKDPNTSMPDTMQALGDLYLANGIKLQKGEGGDEQLQHLLGTLRTGNISDSDRDQLASLLEMSPDRLAEVQKQFQTKGGDGQFQHQNGGDGDSGTTMGKI